MNVCMPPSNFSCPGKPSSAKLVTSAPTVHIDRNNSAAAIRLTACGPVAYWWFQALAIEDGDVPQRHLNLKIKFTASSLRPQNLVEFLKRVDCQYLWVVSILCGLNVLHNLLLRAAESSLDNVGEV